MSYKAFFVLPYDLMSKTTSKSILNVSKKKFLLNNVKLSYLNGGGSHSFSSWLTLSNSEYIPRVLSQFNRVKHEVVAFPNQYSSIMTQSVKYFLNQRYSYQSYWFTPYSTSTGSESQSVGEILASCEEQLKNEQLEEATLHAEYIVARAIGIKRVELYTTLNKLISMEELENIQKMVNCRLARMPLQYIFGDWDFHSITLKLRPPVFIPRQETEGLVNLALKDLEDIEQPKVLDIGCGSGAISLSLLHKLPQSRCVAVDQSKYATDLTSENADELNLKDRLQIIHGKLKEDSWSTILPQQMFDLIVSNPPYVLRKDLIDLQPEISLYEDLRALDGGKDGLEVIKNILLQGHYYLKESGSLLMEVDPCHQYLLPMWLEKNKTTLKISQFYNDIHGVQRFVKFTKK